MKLHTRVALATAAIVTLVVVALSIATFLAMSRQLIRQTDNSLDARVSAIADDLRNNRPMDRVGRRVRNPLGEALLSTRFDTVTQVVDESGEVLIAIGSVELPVSKITMSVARNPLGGNRRSTIQIDGNTYRMLTVPLASGGALQLAKDVGEIERAQEEIRNWTIVFASLGILGAVLAGWLIARQTIRPIRVLAEAAENIATTSNLDTVLDVDGDADVRRLVASFNSMLLALRASNQRQRQLIQDTNHEIRTPLTSLRANSELLERKDLSEEIRAEILRDIRIEVDELTSLSRELGVLTSDERLTEEITKVDALEIAIEVGDRARRRTGREVIVDGTSQVINVRRNQFERAVHNLVDNALKFSSAPSPVIIAVTENSLSVSDSGPGIAATDRSRIFERFYRADATRSLPGSGLGLAIVKQFVDDHAGRIEVMDRPGGGTTIRIKFE